MATRTLEHSRFGDGAVRVEIDVSDANWRVSRFRVINQSGYALGADVYELGALVFQAIAPAGEITTWNVSGVQLGWQEPYWNNVSNQWEDGGIEMGNYVVQARWPA